MTTDRWYHGRLWHGMELSGWLRLLARNRFAVSPSRVPAALSITLVSAVNTALRGWQAVRFGSRAARVPITPDPVFIVGHWRTGTTLLHELLAMDPRHRCPTTYESLCPNHFLVSERFVRRWLWFILPRTRPMDNVRLSFDRPQEDEAALCNRGVPSPFATVAFPNRPPQCPRYASLEGLSEPELASWGHAFRSFMRLLLLKRPGQLVLKSPQHTFRLKILQRMFPQARFIHLVRDPYVVFPSTVHFWMRMCEVHGLQRPNLRQVQAWVFETLPAMYQELEEARKLIEPGRFYDLTYERLTADPVAAVRDIYEHFQWSDFAAVLPSLRKYSERAKRHKTNHYDLSPELRDEITRRWAPYIEKYGYVKAHSLCRSS
jgi:omega-hydroxy-beta-dihydromenaquinone-9 sulfotransferase